MLSFPIVSLTFASSCYLSANRTWSGISLFSPFDSSPTWTRPNLWSPVDIYRMTTQKRVGKMVDGAINKANIRKRLHRLSLGGHRTTIPYSFTYAVSVIRKHGKVSFFFHRHIRLKLMVPRRVKTFFKRLIFLLWSDT